MKRLRRKVSADEIEALMVVLLADAIYPVLYPIEQQDMAIQARHRARVVHVAKAAWQAFIAVEAERSME